MKKLRNLVSEKICLVSERNIVVKGVVFFSRNISVLLDASKDGKVTLVVSYVVSNASWTPLYDVRAFNKDSTVQV